MQVVDYRTGARADAEPALVLASQGELEREPLTPGRELAYTLGERHCAGAIDDEEHLPCVAPAAPYCELHDSTWVCAKCTGTCLKREMDCHTDHVIYLAAFAPATFKVGVTGRSDPAIRLREQGADRGAVVGRVADGRIARELEAEIAATTPLPDSVRVATKVEGMGLGVDERAWERLLEGFDVETTYDFEYGLGLDTAPIPDTFAAGTVLGTKGRVLVVERSGGRFAVDMRSLVGYELEPGAETRALQSNLGSFG
ncbi:DUF2797 family protein [Natronomonas moolapensis 8.8.11]|uniref:DUF2797 family protein n=1 Tax=Natronomonas moolapensis (strain DSM 18674 / CECT 7526 / JCM 14361 / 8.8.11) TaxID=268739 RepID=M1Y0X3_NATM8|nr:DUF2797 domain-containing protein [Natronomonas moolapensis]CCQ36134.1 DUF2797 family protein [Natronomonas moolapensis 8.8.11]